MALNDFLPGCWCSLFQMTDTGSHCYSIYFPHRMHTKPFHCPAYIRKIRKFAANIVVRYAKEAAVFMPSCNDMKIGAASVYFSFILAGCRHLKRVYSGCPRHHTSAFLHLAFITVTHAAHPLHQILAGNSRQDDFCVNCFLIHLRTKRERVRHQVVDQTRVPV